jgi:hypothetical protein
MNRSGMNRVGLAVLAAALAMIGLGILRGEPSVVFEKATRVCLECIGIG